MGGLTSRVARVAERLGVVLARVVVVTSDPTGGPAGGIRPLPNRAGFMFTVAAEFECDPLSGLDDRQRGRIGPTDRLIAVVYGDDPDGELDRTPAADRE